MLNQFPSLLACLLAGAPHWTDNARSISCLTRTSVPMQLLDGPQSLGMLLAGGVAQPNGHLSTAQKDGVFQTARAMYNFSGILLAEASNQQSVLDFYPLLCLFCCFPCCRG